MPGALDWMRGLAMPRPTSRRSRRNSAFCASSCARGGPVFHRISGPYQVDRRACRRRHGDGSICCKRSRVLVTCRPAGHAAAAVSIMRGYNASGIFLIGGRPMKETGWRGR